MPQILRGDVGHFFQRPAAQQRLEQSRRLENRESHVLHADRRGCERQAAFALDAGQGFDADSCALGIVRIAMVVRVSGSTLGADRPRRGTRQRSR